MASQIRFPLVFWFVLAMVQSLSVMVGGQGAPAPASVSPNGRLDEGLALELFLNATYSNDPHFYSNNTCGWNTQRVTCDNTTRRVVHLNFSSMNLTGRIPPKSIGNLTALESVDLSNNLLSGRVPEDMGKLPNLVSLNLSSNLITGNFSTLVQNLSSLQKVDISGNSMVGVVSDFSHLASLSVVRLRRNRLTGSFPLNFSHNLTELDLTSNSLTGQLPSSLFGPRLSHLYLANNRLTGSFPLNFSHNLTELDLTSNNLTGQLPSSLFGPRLSHLYLASNRLSGNISAVTAATALQVLDLSNNHLWGPIPKLEGQLVSLKLQDNRFTGDIPKPLLATLKELVLGGNKLTGQIPSYIPNSLSVLDLRDNQLTGNVTSLVDSMRPSNSILTILDLSSNNFSVQDFPSNLSHLENLTWLSLADNPFANHDIPILSDLTKLEHLNLSTTSLSGNIPLWLGHMENLTRLDLSHNDLVGSIPGSVASLTKLETLDLSRNHLTGQIPDNFTDLTFLSYFNVSNNNLSGDIPTKNQFNTFTNASFFGNPDLCGPQLVNATCPRNSSGNGTTGDSGRKGKSKGNTGAIISGLVTGILVILIAVAAMFLWWRISRRTEKKPLWGSKDESRHVSGPMQYEKDAETWALGVKDPAGINIVMFEKPLLTLTFADLLQATAHFSKDMQIADGGYGPVYKGVLPDTTQLAIKVLVEVGFADDRKAAARIESLAKIKHTNLVPLAGYCLVGEDSVLIYEYMVNGDLHRWMHELPEGTRNPEDWSRDTWEHQHLDGVGGAAGDVSGEGEYLNWPTRHKIALGTARALAFLHHGCSPHVIHRDVKSSNILLDENFEAHLVDSGLAGIARTSGTPIIGGTLGYVPPEYGQTWQATTRGDVYSFGVVLLELVTGRQPTGHYFHDSYGGNLVGWVRSMIKMDKRGQKALDPKLVSRGFVPDMLETLRIGYLCTAETPAKRPTMQQVVGLLKDCQSGLV